MCGVVGYYSAHPSHNEYIALQRLLLQSKIRGLHAFGVAYYDSTGVRQYVSRQLGDVLDLLREKGNSDSPPQFLIAHARYDLSGDYRVLSNNQPLVVQGVALAFNGVISMATQPEFEREFGYKCESENDGEILIRHMLAGGSAQEFVKQMRGSFAGVFLKEGKLLALRNERRPLWRAQWDSATFFASTRDIFFRAGFVNAESVEPGKFLVLP